jgi:hypothetical protein
MEAGAGTKTLAKDDTVASIEEWLPAARDVEVMLGLGQLTNLVGQIASSFMGEEEVRAALPKVPADTEPIAFAIDLEGGRTRAAVVVPAAVLKLAARTGLDRAVAPSGAAPGTTPPAPAAPSAPAGDAP